MAHNPSVIRNVALFGHSGSGKTALVDALAYMDKVSSRHGNTADGTSIGDTEPEEKERKQTLTSHLFSFPLGDGILNVLDTPGHPDFLADAFSSLSVVETGMLVINAASGVSFHARRLWQEAAKSGIGRGVIVTHPDSENVDFKQLYEEIVEVLGDMVVPVTYPDGDSAAFSKINDVISGDGPDAAEYLERMEDRIAYVDDALMEHYLETGDMTKEELLKFMPKAISTGRLAPLFVVCPPREIGIRKINAFLESYFPTPVTFGGRAAGTPGSDSHDQIIEADPEAPFAGKVFKVMLDPFVGRMSYVRCFRGSIKADGDIHNVRLGKTDKLHGMLMVEGAETKNADSAGPGDIFIVAKMEGLELEDSVCAPDAPLEFPKEEFPDPAYSLAVHPASRGDEQKINQGLEKLAAEDPTFSVDRDAKTGEMLIHGLSPLHLEVQLARLKRRYGVATEQTQPQVPYSETITGKADGHHRHKKQSGGRGQFAEVYLRVQALDRGQGFKFVDSVVGGAIPRQFIPEVEKGIRKFLDKGVLAGCQVVDVQAELYDGKFHDVDSDQLSFQLAGERAFADGFEKSKPILLEPVMEVEIQIPDRFTGDVTSNLSTLRGRMLGMDMDGGVQVIKAHVPMKEMQDYATQLRSITAGEGSFTMKPSHYDPVPPNVQAEVVAAHKAAQESK